MKTFFIRRRGVLQRAPEKRLANIVAELNRVVGCLVAESQLRDEGAFQVAFTERLGNCHRELKMHLAAPLLKPRRPSAQDIDECLRKGSGYQQWAEILPREVGRKLVFSGTAGKVLYQSS
jgi:hypothetical protein